MKKNISADAQLKNQVEVLREISSAMVRKPQILELLNSVLQILQQKMAMERGTFTLRHGDTFRIAAAAGLNEIEIERGQYKLGEGVTGTVAKTGIAEIIPDVCRDRRFRNLTGARLGVKNLAFICVPIFAAEKVIGTLSVDRLADPNVDLAEDLRFLEIVGNLMAEAVSEAQKENDEKENLRRENQRLRDALSAPDAPGNLIGNSNAMREVYELIRQVAPSNATVLIRGGTGTGKELVAHAIYQTSPRFERPFVALNCGALPENLVESELFGHEKGAFTGAVNQRRGRVEIADSGVLFLDEIGDLAPAMQVKLLRFIQERVFSRVGSNQEMRSDVRLIAATSRNLEDLMAQGKFREDLYYRLNVFPIVLPDLHQRRSDVILLAEHFIAKYNARHSKNVQRLSTNAINLLMTYHWPGNVRELENCIERGVLTGIDDCIHSYNLPPSLQSSDSVSTPLLSGEISFNSLVDSFERDLIVEALKKHRGNMSAAGRTLALSPRVMHYKINRLKIKPETYRVRHGVVCAP